MRYFKHIAKALCMTALGVMALTGCEGADQYGIDSPDWIKDKIDSINNAKQPHEEVLEGMQEDVARPTSLPVSGQPSPSTMSSVRTRSGTHSST